MKLHDLATQIEAEVFNPHQQNEHLEFKSLAPLSLASSDTLSFYINPRFKNELVKTKAAAVILAEANDNLNCIQLIHKNPYAAMAKAAQLFFSYKHNQSGQSSLAYLAKNTCVSEQACIYPFAYIEENVSIGKNTVIYPHTFIGANSQIGNDCVIFPGVVIMTNVQIKDRVIIHPNCVLGGDGFGFAPSTDCIEKVPQTGGVMIDSDVELGSLSNVDRATFGHTKIARSTKLDSLVHVGHNAEVAEESILCGGVKIAGSAKVGKRFTGAGNAAIGPGIEIADHVTLGAKCGVVQDIEQKGQYQGYPARPAKQWLREVNTLKRLPELFKRVRQLEEKLKS